MVFFGFLQTAAQDRCGTVEIMQSLRNKRSVLESDDQFEQWLKKHKARPGNRINGAQQFKIPVVVHIIHRGEAVGVGTNVPDEQVISQIKILNQDFNRLNSDATNTPSEFQLVAGSLDIEFVLAKQSPEGGLTTGIVRVNGGKTQWAISEDASLKAVSYWPAEDYLNIWVTNLSSGYLGYAQFPVSGLAGLEDAEDNRLTDGVVIDYSVFGSIDDGAFNLSTDFNKGRTATHEVGHFLGLRHIWGDDNGACGGNGDYVEDTPDQGNSSSGCPSNPQTSCSVHKMFQNYMDYTNDACMNLFTQEQVSRMTTVLENSPRRTTLLESPGLDAPVTYANNLALEEIVSPLSSQCAGTAIPEVTLRNFGIDEITSARIQVKVNGGVTGVEEVIFQPALQSLETINISLPSPSMSLLPGHTEIEFEILETNNTADENPDDNIQRITASVPESIAIPFQENFEVMPAAWNLANADGKTTWTIQAAPDSDPANTAAYLNFYQYQNAAGQLDILTTPLFDLSQAAAPYLTFSVAYANRQQYEDGLKIYVLTGCNNNITQGTQVYSKAGSTLATVSSSTGSFTPTESNQWRKEIVDLRSFIGQSQVQLAFVGVNDGGNNLYLDHISLLSTISENVAIKSVVHPAPVRCGAATEPVLLVQNKSDVTITSLNVHYTLNAGTEMTIATGEDFSLLPGGETEVTLPSVALTAGDNTLAFSLSDPNGFTDIDPSDNTKSWSVSVNTASDRIPLRENFDSNTFQDQWTIINPAGGNAWETASTNYNQSLYFNAAGTTEISDEAWLVSPSFDFSDATTASIFFDFSHGYNSQGAHEDALGHFKVLASTNCGNTYDHVLFDKSSEDLPVSTTSKTTAPSATLDWTHQYLNLNDFAGMSDVRLAFISINDNSHALYLDNIEFFTSDNPSPLSATEPFVVYGTGPQSPGDFYITFNLDTRQPVSYELVDAMGKQIVHQELQDVLNQTYQVEAQQAAGLYILRLQIGQTYYATKVIAGK
jgi:hypothetical protein